MDLVDSPNLYTLNIKMSNSSTYVHYALTCVAAAVEKLFLSVWADFPVKNLDGTSL